MTIKGFYVLFKYLQYILNIQLINMKPETELRWEKGQTIRNYERNKSYSPVTCHILHIHNVEGVG